MIKRYLVPLILFLLSLLMLIGSQESRMMRASILGRTIFYPFVHSVSSVHSNSQLRDEVKDLKAQLASQTLKTLALQNELKLFSTSLAVAFDTGLEDFEVAEVIGYAGPFHQRNLIVDKGTFHGVSLESPVVSSSGIVGKVINAADTYCVVLPFTNPQFQMPVMDSHTIVQGILQSDLRGTLSMNMIKLGSEISVGDTIVTSNLSRLFPKGYPVGRVKRLKESTDNLFITAEISPFTLVENLEHVFILKDKKRKP
ncbi:MAG: rod shape-determining protein MreC [Candidatus Cloacimonetes bacterium]|nr:rod shape-determining protein MreC [Candidatus Cloacimonadota bacterium]